MEQRRLNKIKLTLLKQIDLLVWRHCHQTLGEVVNDLYIRNLCIRPDLTADEMFTVLRNNRILAHISGREAQELRDVIDRLAQGTYGLCQQCGKGIDECLLEDNPTRRYCSVCERTYERSYTTMIGVMKNVNVFPW